MLDIDGDFNLSGSCCNLQGVSVGLYGAAVLALRDTAEGKRGG